MIICEKKKETLYSFYKIGAINKINVCQIKRKRKRKSGAVRKLIEFVPGMKKGICEKRNLGPFLTFVG